MTTIRVKKDKRYSTIYNPPFENKALSWEARGLLAYLLTKPDDWTIMLGDLVKQGDAKLFKVRRMLKELDKVGHVKRKRINAGGGKFTWETTINERPTIYQSSIDGSSIDGSTIDGKPHDIIIPELPSTELPSTDRRESAPVGAPLTGTNGVVIFGEGQEYAEIPAPDKDKLLKAMKEIEIKLSGEPETFSGISLRERSEKPPKKTKARDPRLDHPALVAYRDAMRLTPPELWRDEIITIDDLEKWKAILKSWLGKSFKPGNIEGLLDVYRHGWKQNGHAPKPAQPTPTMPSEEELNRQRADVAAKVKARDAKRKAGVKDPDDF